MTPKRCDHRQSAMACGSRDFEMAEDGGSVGPIGFIIQHMSDGIGSGALKRDPHLRMHCVNVYVRNQDRSLKFYLEKLGFHLAFDKRLQGGERWVAVAPPDGSTLLALVTPSATSPTYKLIGRSTNVVFITEDVTSKHFEWSKRGVVFSHTPRLKRIRYRREEGAAAPKADSGAHDSPMLGEHENIWGGVYTRFRDIDGNSFSLVSFDEISQALETQRRAAAEKLENERGGARELPIAEEVQARLFPQKRPLVDSLDY